MKKGELPPGTTLDPDTGSWTGSPTEEGFYYFVVAATDSVGNEALELFGIRINDPGKEGEFAVRAKGYQEVYEARHL